VALQGVWVCVSDGRWPMQAASDLVRQSRSVEGALLVAAHCREHSLWAPCIEFLLLAGKREDAFACARVSEWWTAGCACVCICV
jgi:hypothetical protein